MKHSNRFLENQEKTNLYVELLKDYNKEINIYSEHAYPRLDFHIRDSQLITTLINRNQSVLDFGSGSGLPAIVMAIFRPDLKITAVESKQKKASFLMLAKEELALYNFNVICDDINNLNKQDSLKYRYFTAKAFAPWKKVIQVFKKMGKKGSRLIVPVSQNQVDEIQGEKKIFDVKEMKDNGIKYHYLCQDWSAI